MSIVQAVIFANGELPDADLLRGLLRPDDFIIAADGGLKHIDRLHLHPHLVIGDMDSIVPRRLKSLEGKTEIVRFPQEKDETDLELAVQAAIGRGFKDILIAAATGGRLDQTLGNISLLLRAPAGVSMRLENGEEEIMFCWDKLVIHGKMGDTVSLIPWGMKAEGVTTTGLKYALHRETLCPDHTRGISNLLSSSRAVVQITQGSLLCIHTRNPGASE